MKATVKFDDYLKNEKGWWLYLRKTYKIKVTKKLLNQLRSFWQKVRKIQDCYDTEIAKVETKMMKKTGIKDIEFFFSENEIVGIGNAGRNMRLIHDTEL